MRAFTLDAHDTIPAARDLPDPVPDAGELLVRVRASSVNPVDNAIASGMLRGMAEYTYPVILGRDFAGSVERIGAGVTRFAPGDEVFGFVRHANPTLRDGSWAELIVASEADVAGVPSGVALSDAGAAPLAGITALFAIDALDLTAGRSVLVVGASGGVGSFAVQLAANAGADVTATGLAEDAEYLRGLGADTVIDRDGDVAAAVRAEQADGVDALLDLVSFTGEAFDAYADALRPGGRAASPLPGVGEGSGRFPIMATTDPTALGRVAEHLHAGTLRVPIQDRYPLAQAGDALEALATSHTRGKIAIEV
jgi:NADPH:quinone reductase-like Zn-dependent oxidoreductase